LRETLSQVFWPVGLLRNGPSDQACLIPGAFPTIRAKPNEIIV
jgi:hypothetical protein